MNCGHETFIVQGRGIGHGVMDEESMEKGEVMRWAAAALSALVLLFSSACHAAQKTIE
jgi:hypothetical protein